MAIQSNVSNPLTLSSFQIFTVSVFDAISKPEASYICSSEEDGKIFLYPVRDCPLSAQNIAKQSINHCIYDSIVYADSNLALSSNVIIFWNVNVAKSLVFLKILLTVLLSISGCPISCLVLLFQRRLCRFTINAGIF